MKECLPTYFCIFISLRVMSQFGKATRKSVSSIKVIPLVNKRSTTTQFDK